MSQNPLHVIVEWDTGQSYKFYNILTYFLFKNVKIQIFIAIFGFCIQMSTNKPSIGSVVLEILPWILRKYSQISILFASWKSFWNQIEPRMIWYNWRLLLSKVLFYLRELMGFTLYIMRSYDFALSIIHCTWW